MPPLPPNENDFDWCLRLFVSADLVGSTSYKASSQGESPDWVHAFVQFFNEFPRKIVECYGDVGQLVIPKSCSQPQQHLQPWKFLGDEILFSVALHKHYEAAIHLLAFQQAMRSFPGLWSEGKDKKVSLRIKGAAWLAGFPVKNRVFRTADPSGSPLIDYIGPSIDLGFRIAKHSNERFMVVSADLAWQLITSLRTLKWYGKVGLKSSSTQFNCDSHFNFHLHRVESLKGVLGGDPYPIILWDAREGDTSDEEELLGLHTPKADHNKLHAYLEKFILLNPPQMRLPFIKSGEEEWGELHDGFEEKRKELIDAIAAPAGYPAGESTNPRQIGERIPVPDLPPTETTQSTRRKKSR